MTDFRSSIYLVYKDEFIGDSIKDWKYLHREERTTAREIFKLVDKDKAGSKSWNLVLPKKKKQKTLKIQ